MDKVAAPTYNFDFERDFSENKRPQRQETSAAKTQDGIDISLIKQRLNEYTLQSGQPAMPSSVGPYQESSPQKKFTQGNMEFYTDHLKQYEERVQQEIAQSCTNQFEQLQAIHRNLQQGLELKLQQNDTAAYFKEQQLKLLKEMKHLEENLTSQGQCAQRLGSIMDPNARELAALRSGILREYQNQLDTSSIVAFVDFENLLRRYIEVRKRQERNHQRLEYLAAALQE